MSLPAPASPPSAPFSAAGLPPVALAAVALPGSLRAGLPLLRHADTAAFQAWLAESGLGPQQLEQAYTMRDQRRQHDSGAKPAADPTAATPRAVVF